MSEPGEQRKRRRRRRASAPQGQVPAAAEAADTAEPVQQRAEPAAARNPTKRRRAPRDKGSGGTERGMRDLVGPGHSAVGVEGALRARDVNRPTDADLAEAERDVSIVRRNWRPPPEKG